MKFDKLKEGMILYSLSTQKMGNTTMRTKAVHTVKVISVDHEKQTAMCSWNGNRAMFYNRRMIEALKEKEPILVDAGLGKRLPTREERAVIVAERKAKESK